MAECFPGAQVTSADGDSFAGSVKVKLGPIALVYNGTGTFVEKDEAAKRFVVDAKGKDKRGNGTAGAHVTVRWPTRAAPRTCRSTPTWPSPASRPSSDGASCRTSPTSCSASSSTASSSGWPAASRAGAEPAPAPRRNDGPAAATYLRPRSSSPRPLRGRFHRPAPANPPTEALDLGSAVLPVLAKTYWKQGVGLLVVLALLWRLLRR